MRQARRAWISLSLATYRTTTHTQTHETKTNECVWICVCFLFCCSLLGTAFSCSACLFKLNFVCDMRAYFLLSSSSSFLSSLGTFSFFLLWGKIKSEKEIRFECDAQRKQVNPKLPKTKMQMKRGEGKKLSFWWKNS